MSKQIIALAALVAVLSGVMLYKNMAQSPEDVVRYQDLLALFPSGKAAEDVAGLSLTLPGESAPALALAKGGNGWVLASHWGAPADEAVLADTLKTLTGLRAEFRAAGDTVLADTGLTPEAAPRLTLTGEDGEELMELLVGKTQGRSTFVRPATGDGSDAAYVATKNLRGVLGLEEGGLSVQRFLETEILRVEAATAQTLSLTRDGATVVLERAAQQPEAAAEATESENQAAQPEWAFDQGTRPQPADALAKQLLDDLWSVRVTDIVNPAAVPEDALTHTLTVTTTEGATTLRGGTAGETSYISLEGRPQVYILPQASLERLFPAPPQK